MHQGHFHPIGIVALQVLKLVLDIIAQEAKKPIGMFIAEDLKLQEVVFSIAKDLLPHAKGKHLFEGTVWVVGGLIGIQKTAVAKMLLTPLQHFHNKVLALANRKLCVDPFHRCCLLKKGEQPLLQPLFPQEFRYLYLPDIAAAK